MNGLLVEKLSVEAGGKEVLVGLSLSVEPGETVVLMGRNGSGKSSLANALIARPGYAVSKGRAELDGGDLLSMGATERARAGLFVASQYPTEIPGLSNGQFLRAMSNIRAAAMGRAAGGAISFLKEAKAACNELGVPEDFLQRSLGSGMSGGEKKRNELLQLRFFEPKIAILDEIDSGLDVDAWAQAIAFVKAEQRRVGFGLLIISHYAKMAEVFENSRVCLLADGVIAKMGDARLARSVENHGFEKASS